VNRRLIIVGTIAAALGGGLVAPALAGTGAEPQREKICVAQPTLMPDGYCITWNNPFGQATP
jgi:hypothetical protein